MNQLSYRGHNNSALTEEKRETSKDQLKEIKTNTLMERRILSDKSNTKESFKVYQSEKVVIQKTRIALKEEEEEVEVVDTHPVEKEVEEVVKEELDEDVASFFEDNKSRYVEDEDDLFDVVPVLPIVVPQRMRHLFKKNKRRLLEDNEEEVRYKKHRPALASLENTHPLRLDIDQTALEHEHEQEMKSKLVMLQTDHVLQERHYKDPMMVYEYADEIFANLYSAEPKTMADPSYACSQQHEVTWKMRSVLIDWVIEIHYLFQLLPETLFLAVNIIDRFLSLRTVVLGKLQLVGITALFIATKFEEMSAPPIQDFLYMTDKAVEEDELIKAECFILKVIDFRICYPNPLNFLRRVCTEENDCDVHTRMLAKYFMEISCVDHRFIGTRPSAIAAASFWLAQKMLAKGNWTEHLTQLSGYSTEDLKPTVESMLDYLSQPVSHEAFFRKWSCKRLSKASIFVRDWINKYYVS